MLKIHPDSARIFTKMSPDEELVTLKFYVCRHCNYWHIFLGIWWSVYGRSVFCHLVCMFRKIGLYFQICLGMDLEKNKLAKLREGLRRASRRCHDLSTGNTHFWKWSEWVPKCCTNIVCCQDMWELYFECKKFKETVQTVNFTVFTMCSRELPAEKPYFWWKLAKRKRIFLNVSH